MIYSPRSVEELERLDPNMLVCLECCIRIMTYASYEERKMYRVDLDQLMNTLREVSNSSGMPIEMQQCGTISYEDDIPMDESFCPYCADSFIESDNEDSPIDACAETGIRIRVYGKLRHTAVFFCYIKTLLAQLTKSSDFFGIESDMMIPVPLIYTKDESLDDLTCNSCPFAHLCSDEENDKKSALCQEYGINNEKPMTCECVNVHHVHLTNDDSDNPQQKELLASDAMEQSSRFYSSEENASS